MNQARIIDRILDRTEVILQERGDVEALLAEQERNHQEAIAAEAKIIVTEAIERIAQAVADNHQRVFNRNDTLMVEIMPVDVVELGSLQGVSLMVYHAFSDLSCHIGIIHDGLGHNAKHSLAIDVNKIG